MICSKDTFAKKQAILFLEMSDYDIDLIYSHYKPW